MESVQPCCHILVMTSLAVLRNTACVVYQHCLLRVHVALVLQN